METRVSFTSKIIFNGREYASLEEMPVDVRKLWEQAMAAVRQPRLQVRADTQFDANRNGIPDVLESGVLPLEPKRRTLFSAVSLVSLMVLLVWLAVLVLRR
jgi:hypothetical protein